MRYVRPTAPELLMWLRAELGQAADALLVTSGVDEAGVALFREQAAALLDAGGTLTFVVPTARAAASVLAGLTLPDVGRLAVLVRDVPPSLNGCVLTASDGSARGYLGSSELRYVALTVGAPGVLLDGARDRGGCG